MMIHQQNSLTTTTTRKISKQNVLAWGLWVTVSIVLNVKRNRSRICLSEFSRTEIFGKNLIYFNVEQHCIKHVSLSVWHRYNYLYTCIYIPCITDVFLILKMRFNLKYMFFSELVPIFYLVSTGFKWRRCHLK